jgi:UDPglucose 6-dehydrogenase
MRVAVVGAGRVGVASAAAYALAGHRVSLVERDARRAAALRRGILPFLEPALAAVWTELHGQVPVYGALPEAGRADLLVCCVGTPAGPDGRADLGQIASVWAELKGLSPEAVVLRSTVPPGTGRRLAAELPAGVGYVAFPEFLREGTALEDALRPARLVIGADDPGLRRLAARLQDGGGAPLLEVDIPTAELIKAAANAHLALRVSFMNELAWIAEEVGADIVAVGRGLGLDPRIGPHFLEAGLGFGGPCLPKDLAALRAVGEELGCPVALLAAAEAVNGLQPRRVVERLQLRLGALEGRRIGIWGLAFKPGTEEVASSPALALLEALAAAGAHLLVHDPEARWDPDRPGIARVAHPEAAARGAAALVLATAWPVYRSVEPEAVVREMAPPALVYDTRNGLQQDAWIRAGAEYVGWGRPAIGLAPTEVRSRWAR